MFKSSLPRLVGFAGLLFASLAVQAEPVRLGVLKFGTVNWEMDTIRHHGLDKAAGMELELRPLASSQGLKIALQGGAVDVIVADWVWVARQRAAGQKLSFIPYSTTIGGVVIPEGSLIRSMSDLPGKRVGIGGGPLDKTWLLMRALALHAGDLELDSKVEKVFGAPPLINQQLLAGEVSVVVNYWHYVARLEADGHHQMWPAEQMLRALGIAEKVPFLGFVFAQSWGEANSAQVAALAQVSRQAKTRLCEEDAEWKRIAALVKADSGRLSNRLRRRFCEGLPRQWGEAERSAAAKVFDILREQGGSDLVGSATSLDPETFWSEVRY